MTSDNEVVRRVQGAGVSNQLTAPSPEVLTILCESNLLLRHPLRAKGPKRKPKSDGRDYETRNTQKGTQVHGTMVDVSTDACCGSVVGHTGARDTASFPGRGASHERNETRRPAWRAESTRAQPALDRSLLLQPQVAPAPWGCAQMSQFAKASRRVSVNRSLECEELAS